MRSIPKRIVGQLDLLTRISTVNGVLFRKDSALGYLRSSFTQKGILPTHSRAHLYTSTPAGPPANQTRQHRHPRRRFSPISLQAPTPNVHLLFGLIYFNAPNNRIPLLTSFSLHCHSAACAFGRLFRVTSSTSISCIRRAKPQLLNAKSPQPFKPWSAAAVCCHDSQRKL